MVSLFKLLRSLLPGDNIIVVKRMPPAKPLRAHLLGLTMGLLLVLLHLVVSAGTLSWLSKLFVLLWYAVATYLGAVFLVLTAIVILLAPATAFFVALQAHFVWYLIGYVFGAVLSIVYNDLVYLFINIFERRRIKFAFALDKSQPVNIIKSPREEEEVALLSVVKPIRFYVEAIRRGERVGRNANKIESFIRKARRMMSDRDFNRLLEHLASPPSHDFESDLSQLKQELNSTDPDIRDTALARIVAHIEPIVEKYLKLKERKFYNYEIPDPPEQPYTIAFVGNPTIRKRRTDPTQPFQIEKDPIITDLDLFVQSVDHALTSFTTDSVLGRPELLSRIRVVTIFKDIGGENFSMVEEFQEEAYSSGGERIDNHIIDPRREMHAHLANIFSTISNSPITLDDIDVVYAMTASPSHDRSSAHPSDWIEIRPGEPLPPNSDKRPGIPFAFDYDPCKNKVEYDACQDAFSTERVILEPVFKTSDFDATNFKRIHDFYATLAGRVALNVLSARRYSYLHEFGHAMCSAFHGEITDEYSDFFLVGSDVPDDLDFDAWFYVNRIERDPKKMVNGKYFPVHKEFVGYNSHARPENSGKACTVYYSDLDHPSSQEGWLSYFPERAALGVTCTMDRSSGAHQFDPLISIFMYDRLFAKLCRPRRPQIALSQIWDGEDAATQIVTRVNFLFLTISNGAALTAPQRTAIQSVLVGLTQELADAIFGAGWITVVFVAFGSGSLTATVELKTASGRPVAEVFTDYGRFFEATARLEAQVKSISVHAACQISELLAGRAAMAEKGETIAPAKSAKTAKK